MLLTEKAECSTSVFFYDIVQNRFRNLRWCLKELIFKNFYLSVTLAARHMQQVSWHVPVQNHCGSEGEMTIKDDLLAIAFFSSPFQLKGFFPPSSFPLFCPLLVFLFSIIASR